jgi:hypothetical protein
VPDWWLLSHKRFPTDRRRGFDTRPAGVVASKERNDRVFNNAMMQAAQLSTWIKEEGLRWVLAGCSVLSCCRGLMLLACVVVVFVIFRVTVLRPSTSS